MSRARHACIWVATLCLAGCVSYGQVVNQPLHDPVGSSGYSFFNPRPSAAGSDTVVLLTLSGGGTRAAALAYGVMQGLRDTAVPGTNGSRRLLDHVTGISAVSGGSFTAAYYGLHGDAMFDTFEDEFLRRDVAGALFRGLFNPLHWFSRKGRTDLAADYFDDHVFKGATFADLQHGTGPLIVINASDLANGSRFSFLQEYFSLLCTDLSSYPIARAVTASSAVPLVFHPVVLKRYDTCTARLPEAFNAIHEAAIENSELSLVLDGLGAERNRREQAYLHLVDGGISDNLGLRALYDTISLAGGAKAFIDQVRTNTPKRLVLISVNAAVSPQFKMTDSNRRPGVEETALAMSALQLQRYNATTLNLMRRSLSQWTETLSTTDKPVKSWFIELNLEAVESQAVRERLNAIPTSYSLSNEQVDLLITTGRSVLNTNSEYQDLVEALGVVP